MERSPYTPPGSLLSPPAEARPGIGWRVYVWSLVTLSGLGYAILGLSWMNVADVTDLGITFVGLLGLAGFAHHRRVLSPEFWRAWFVVAVVWDAFYAFILDLYLGVAGQIPGEDPTTLPWLVAAYALIIPIYVGLFRYGYRSDALWQRNAAASS